MDKWSCCGNDRCSTVFVHQNRPKLGSLDVAEVCLKIKEGQMLKCVKNKKNLAPFNTPKGFQKDARKSLKQLNQCCNSFLKSFLQNEEF